MTGDNAKVFDASSLKVTELRAILQSRDIAFNKNSKKAKLVQLVNDTISNACSNVSINSDLIKANLLSEIENSAIMRPLADNCAISALSDLVDDEALHLVSTKLIPKQEVITELAHAFVTHRNPNADSNTPKLERVGCSGSTNDSSFLQIKSKSGKLASGNLEISILNKSDESQRETRSEESLSSFDILNAEGSTMYSTNEIDSYQMQLAENVKNTDTWHQKNSQSDCMPELQDVDMIGGLNSKDHEEQEVILDNIIESLNWNEKGNFIYNSDRKLSFESGYSSSLLAKKRPLQFDESTLPHAKHRKQKESLFPLDPTDFVGSVSSTSVPHTPLLVEQNRLDFGKLPVEKISSSTISSTFQSRRPMMSSPVLSSKPQSSRSYHTPAMQTFAPSNHEFSNDNSSNIETALVESSTATIPRNKKSKKKSANDKSIQIKNVLESPRRLLSTAFFVFMQLLSVCTVLATAFYSMWYRERLYYKGFCGQEHETVATFADLNSPLLRLVGQKLDKYLQPLCTPCPAHAYCFANLSLVCMEDFVEYRPWDNIWRPYNTICVPDSLKAEKLEIMLSVALDLLHHKNAQMECGVLNDSVAAGLSAEALHDMLLRMKAPYISDIEFETLWNKTLVELKRDPSLTVRQVFRLQEALPGYSIATEPFTKSTRMHIMNDSRSFKVDLAEVAEPGEVQIMHFRSTSLQHVDLKCSIRNSVVHTGWNFKYQILTVVGIVLIVSLLHMIYEHEKLEKIKVSLILREVFGKLQQQRTLARDSEGEKEPYFGATQLRDAILGNEENIKRRVQLWNKIVKRVEENTNIAIKIIEIHGEVMKVWEWVGEW